VSEGDGVARTWTQYGLEFDHTPGVYGSIYSHPRSVEMCKAPGVGEVVTLTLTEDPDGDYWGWLKTGESEPSMVHCRESLFNMCFPYGPQASVEAGHGEILRFRVDRAG
jgi:hypothetical protein